ncbi:hypothetical protein OSCI_410008 [Kamptonema sp. PCC 6506]|nr:hypothetical protein OSCI_410008 [Kamptonema sp. PCC 6506]
MSISIKSNQIAHLHRLLEKRLPEGEHANEPSKNCCIVRPIKRSFSYR